MSIEKVLYRANATATGGREGSAESSDAALKVQLSTPRELGGAGGPGTNPEQLFAAGYSACFLGALKFVAMQDKVALPATTTVIATDSDRLWHRSGFADQHSRCRCGQGASAGGQGTQCLPVLQCHPRQYRRALAAGVSRRLIYCITKTPALPGVLHLPAMGHVLGLCRICIATPIPARLARLWLVFTLVDRIMIKINDN